MSDIVLCSGQFGGKSPFYRASCKILESKRKGAFRASEARPGIQFFRAILDSGFRRNAGVSDYCKRRYKYPFIILIGSLFLTGILISCSSKPQSRGQNPETRFVKPADYIILEMKIDLTLSDEQELKIRPIIQEQVRRRKWLIERFQNQGSPGLEALRQELKNLRISTEGQLQYLLTNEQMIKYGKMQQEEDQRIISEKPRESEGQQKRQDRGAKSGGS
jgi:hypothetical protein